MLSKYRNPNSLLHKHVKVKYEGVINEIYVMDVDDEMMEVMVSPGTPEEFYAELYFEDHNRGWTFVGTGDAPIMG